MKRAVLTLIPLFGLSTAFLINQSCATKTALEEVEKEKDVAKENIKKAKENLKEARENLKTARSILEEARRKILAHREDRMAHMKEMKEDKIQPVIVYKEEMEKEEKAVEEEKVEMYGTVRVGWCDTLWDISENVYNNPLYWPSIYNINKEKIGEDPWILPQGIELKYKLTLTEEEKEQAVREAIAWAIKFKDRPRSPKCPPK